MKSNVAQIAYAPRPDATVASELDALSAVYEFLIESAASKKADEPAPEPVGRDGTTVQGDSADAQIIQE